MPIGEYLEIEARRRARENWSFFQRFPECFAYPFTHGGVWLLIIGTVLLAFLDAVAWVARLAPGYGPLALMILTVATYGYLFVYMQRIVTATAYGEERVPDWPEFSEWWDDIVRPFLMLIFTIAFCFGFPLGYMIYVGAREEPSIPVLMSLIALGFLYFPMALLAVAMSDNFFALNPFVVFPAILKTRFEYIVACAAFFVVAGVYYLSKVVLYRLIPVPIVPAVVGGFCFLYFLTVNMRLLGIMYYTNRNRLGWYRK